MNCFTSKSSHLDNLIRSEIKDFVKNLTDNEKKSAKIIDEKLDDLKFPKTDYMTKMSFGLDNIHVRIKDENKGVLDGIELELEKSTRRCFTTKLTISDFSKRELNYRIKLYQESEKELHEEAASRQEEPASPKESERGPQEEPRLGREDIKREELVAQSEDKGYLLSCCESNVQQRQAPKSSF